MKHAPSIAGSLLGLAFVAFALMFFLKMMPDRPAPPEGSPAALFMGAMMPTGYMHFVKICELLGGFLVAIPRTRNIGLLFLGPIILNILAFHIFLSPRAADSRILRWWSSAFWPPTCFGAVEKSSPVC